MAINTTVMIFGLLLIILGIVILILKLINEIKGWTTSNNNQPLPPANDPITRPDNAIPFDFDEKANTYEKTFEQTGVKLTLSNVHSTVHPYLLPFSSNEEKWLRNLPIDGYFVLGQILGNIVFYGKDDDHLITLFSDDVTLTFTVPLDYRNKLDIERKEIFGAHIAKLTASIQNLNNSNTGNNNKMIQYTTQQIAALNAYNERNIYIPAYLYVPITKENIQIWKPFQSYTVEDKAGVLSITINFKTWGDQNVSLLSPKPDQIGYGPKT